MLNAFGEDRNAIAQTHTRQALGVFFTSAHNDLLFIVSHSCCVAVGVPINVTHSLCFEKQIPVNYHFFVACVLHCSKTWAASESRAKWSPGECLLHKCFGLVIKEHKLGKKQILFWWRETSSFCSSASLSKKWHSGCCEIKTLGAQHCCWVMLGWGANKHLGLQTGTVPGLNQQLVFWVVWFFLTA